MPAGGGTRFAGGAIPADGCGGGMLVGGIPVGGIPAGDMLAGGGAP